METETEMEMEMERAMEEILLRRMRKIRVHDRAGL
jgi:hypothetical protein